MKILRILFLYIIVFQTINDNIMVDLFGPNVLKFSLIGFIVFNSEKFRTFEYFSTKNLSLIFFVFISIVSIFTNLSTYSNIQNSLTALIALCAYFIIFSQEKSLEQIFIIIIVSIIVSSLYCIFKEETITEYTFRKSGGTNDPNEFTVTVLFGLGILWGFYMDTKRFLFIIFPVILLFLSALISAGSKSGIISLCVLFAIILYYYFTRFKVNIFGVIIFVYLAYYFFSTYFYQDVEFISERFENVDSQEERFKSWNAGWTLFKENMLIGVGPLNYSNIVGIKFSSIEESSREAHNMFIKALVETGILGFMPYLFFIIQKLYLTFKVSKFYILKLMIIGPIFMGFTLSLTFEKYIWLIFGLLCNPFLYNIPFFQKIIKK